MTHQHNPNLAGLSILSQCCRMRIQLIKELPKPAIDDELGWQARTESVEAIQRMDYRELLKATKP